MRGIDQEFADFVHRLGERRGRRVWAAPGPRGAPLLAVLAVVLLGGLAGILLVLAAEDTVRQVAFFRDAHTTVAEVVLVDNGDPVVVFTTEDDQEITATALGTHEHGDSVEVAVRYLPHAPATVVFQDHRWTPWYAVVLMVSVVAVVHLVWHPHGARAGWFWRRARNLVVGPDAGRWSVVGPVATAGVLTMMAAALFALPFVVSDLARLATDPLPLWALAPGLVCAVGALTVAVRAAYRYADRAPVTRPPGPFRLLPTGVLWVPAGVLFTGTLTAILLFAMHSLLAPWEREAVGRAEVLGTDCRSQGRSCVSVLRLHYEADGLAYEEEVVVGSRSEAEELSDGGYTDVVWNAEDPTQVEFAD